MTSVRSPEIALPSDLSLVLSMSYNFAHNDDASSSDFFRVSIEGEATTVEVLEVLGDDTLRPGAWLFLHADVSAFAGETVTLLIEAFDNSSNSIIEAAVDDVVIAESPVFFDDFESSQGWVTDPDGVDTAETGEWERGNPSETTADGEPIQLGDTTSGSQALVTDPSGGDSAAAMSTTVRPRCAHRRSTCRMVVTC